MKKLTVNQELRGVLRALLPEEQAMLQKNLLADGCLDPIITWANHDNTIIDGHHRYEICKANDIPFEVKAMKFDTIIDVKVWMQNNQDGRRNETKAARLYRVGQIYNERKQQHGGQFGPKKGEAQCAPPSEKTAVSVAKELGIGQTQVKKAGNFAAALDNGMTEAQRTMVLTGTHQPLPEDQRGSERDQLLHRLQQGPATKEDLIAISSALQSHLAHFRNKDGLTIDCENYLYTLRPVNHEDISVKTPVTEDSGKLADKGEGEDSLTAISKQLGIPCSAVKKGGIIPILEQFEALKHEPREDDGLKDKYEHCRLAIQNGMQNSAALEKYGFKNQSRYKLAHKVIQSGDEELIDLLGANHLSPWQAYTLIGKSPGERERLIKRMRRGHMTKQLREKGQFGFTKRQVLEGQLDHTYCLWATMASDVRLTPTVFPRTKKPMYEFLEMCNSTRTAVESMLNKIESEARKCLDEMEE